MTEFVIRNHESQKYVEQHFQMLREKNCQSKLYVQQKYPSEIKMKYRYSQVIENQEHSVTADLL